LYRTIATIQWSIVLGIVVGVVIRLIHAWKNNHLPSINYLVSTPLLDLLKPYSFEIFFIVSGVVLVWLLQVGMVKVVREHDNAALLILHDMYMRSKTAKDKEFWKKPDYWESLKSLDFDRARKKSRSIHVFLIQLAHLSIDRIDLSQSSIEPW